jgi:cell wall-associated NlpC family hydrolase
MPVLSNFTFVGPNGAAGTAANHNFANRFRRNVRFVLNNSILLGYQKGGLSIESNGTYDDFVSTTGSSEFKNNIVHAVTAPFKLGSDVTTAGAAASAIQAKATASGSTSVASAADVMLGSPFNLGAPSFIPSAGSPALAGAAFSGVLNNSFFTQVAYKGAFGTSNWMAGWTSFTYTKGAEGY